MEEVLKESAESRKLAISLKHLEYGGHLVEQLFTHSSHMEKLYSTMQSMLSEPQTKEGKLVKVINLVEEKSEWFTKAKASGVHMCFHNDTIKPVVHI